MVADVNQNINALDQKISANKSPEQEKEDNKFEMTFTLSKLMIKDDLEIQDFEVKDDNSSPAV
jgi:hypothetical protein